MGIILNNKNADEQNGKLHVVQIIGSLGQGGAEHLVIEICNKISKDDFKSTLIVLGQESKSSEALLNSLKNAKVSVIFLEKPPKKGKILILHKLFNTLTKLRPDVVHVHLELNSIYAGIISLFYNHPKYVQTIHNTKLVYVKLLRLFNNRYKKFIAISDEVEEVIKDVLRCPENRIIKIYNGVDTKKFSPHGSYSDYIKSISPSEHVVRLVSIGRLTEQKGHVFLINAMKLIEKNSDFILFIIGEGENNEKLLDLTKELGLESKIRFIGNQDDIPSILRSCDIYVMPSLWEGLSVSLLEAISTGIPVVATDVGSNKRLLENSNVSYRVVSPGLVQNLSEGILTLINTLNIKIEIEDGKYLKDEFSIDSFIKSHESLYLDLFKKVN